MKKFLALLLAMVMVIGLVACGTEKPADTTAAAAGNNDDAVETTAAPAEKLEPVTLRMWFHGSNVNPEASAKVMEELNKVLGEKIAVTLEPIWGTWGDFDDSVKTSITAGGTDADIYFTCNWSANEYNKYSRMGSYVKLDDMLDTYAPELKATIPQSIWDCAVTNGAEGMGIYAIPGLKDTATQNCWDVNVTLMKELGFEVPEKLDYFSAEFEQMLAKAKEVKGENFYPLLIEAAVFERMITHSSIVTGDTNPNMLSYYYDAEHPAKDLGSVIVNKYATPEFEKYAQRTYEFAQKGYISPSCMNTETANNFLGECRNNAEYLIGTQVYAFGCEKEFANARGIELKMIPETAAYMDCTSGQGAMMAISASSKNPERALMFLNLLNTDPEVMTMLNYGVEGFTYEKNADNTISFIKENRDLYSPWTNGVGNVRILPPTADQGADFWPEFEAYYNAAEALPLGGFVFDNEAVKSEAMAIGNVLSEFAFGLCSGAIDPADEELGIAAFLAKMESAGAQKIVDAANEQLTAYLAK